MQFRDYIFDLYGTLADVCTDEQPAAFWKGAAQDAEACGARYTGETLRRDYLRLCKEEVRLRAKTLPDVPEAYIEPELLHVFERLLRERGADGAQGAAVHHRPDSRQRGHAGRAAARRHAARQRRRQRPVRICGKV